MIRLELGFKGTAFSIGEGSKRCILKWIGKKEFGVKLMIPFGMASPNTFNRHHHEGQPIF